MSLSSNSRGGDGVHPGPVMTRSGALAIRLVPERKMINFEQHHNNIIIMICMFINIIVYYKYEIVHATCFNSRFFNSIYDLSTFV